MRARSWVGLVSFLVALTIIASVAYTVSGPGNAIMAAYNRTNSPVVEYHDEGWVLPVGLVVIAIALGLGVRRLNGKGVDRVMYDKTCVVQNFPLDHSGARK